MPRLQENLSLTETMTVAQLIKLLKVHDPRARVVLHTASGPTWVPATYVAAKEATPDAQGYNPPRSTESPTIRTVLIA